MKWIGLVFGVWSIGVVAEPIDYCGLTELQVVELRGAPDWQRYYVDSGEHNMRWRFTYAYFVDHGLRGTFYYDWRENAKINISSTCELFFNKPLPESIEVYDAEVKEQNFEKLGKFTGAIIRGLLFMP